MEKLIPARSRFIDLHCSFWYIQCRIIKNTIRKYCFINVEWSYTFNYKGCNIGTGNERQFSNRCYAVWNLDSLESCTITESFFSNSCYAVWNVDFLEPSTIAESTFSNSRNFYSSFFYGDDFRYNYVSRIIRRLCYFQFLLV